MYPVGIAVFLVLACLPWTASARCDCSSQGWVSGCTATVKPDGEGVLISSSSTQCSRVDWYLGSAPQVSVFWGGREWESIAKVAGRPSITVESCRVCKDEKADDPAARTPRQLSMDDAPKSDCEVFLERMVEIGTNVSVHNADAGMRAMNALCGSVEACMKKVQACAD